ncbi:ABC transporter substrate-binding protein [Bradyrhizobium sp. WBOS7]|uniref:ABC transporter substrate-binding protein n=1 Tax=Bradyrhizobium betae TaxID=244734 RepID=A0AAE9NFU5_9BRAD|nr:MULTISPECIES: transporter substrate-binding domain-containing protein [Bradyrhizobium]MDD1573631.1 ABC transporter substrate-binding protein [Bradyrhizobium sp. WBOS1]UUO38322.1 ABC transporter substrate-binding protein [Bradyrhizobium sp. WBOS01]MDD1530164.1 ABC transporter substrate-binding protein [Bradyrhizobium sp. WBOS2]MDD1579462.1 ABC transporter substrate-binding protein [Bradyrhizobium sp. WBOS7]MDD1602127.1 ABC transporter substrate-binding protein [Bradyrhizobium sp. WBOS16]
MRSRAVAWSVAALLSTMASAAPAADDPLRICLDEDRPPLSLHRRGQPDAGFDVLLAQAVAERLGRKLAIQWFESKLDEDSSPQLEANALLSDGRCSLVGGYALTRDSLVAPGMKTARLPGFAGATRDDRRRRVAVGVLAPSQPYVYSPMTVVLGPKASGRTIGDIGDLAGLRLVVESGSLGDAILMTFDKGRLIDSITHLVPGRDDLLGALQRGDHDATLIDLARFDAHRAAHPDTALAASGYYYPIGANRGYVGLASDGALIEAVNKALSALAAEGRIAEFGRQAGLTYLPPREPAILGDVWTKIIQR